MKYITGWSLLGLLAVYGLPQTTDDLAPSDELDIQTDTSAAVLTSLGTLACPPDSSPEMQNLTRLLPKVLDNAVSISNKSWEIGSLTQSLLEVYDPRFAPFEWDYASTKGNQIPWRVMNITERVLESYDWSGSPGDKGGWYDKRRAPQSDGAWLKEYLSDIPRVPVKSVALMDGHGSQGDPCSVGPAVWMLAQLAEREEVRKRGYKDPQDYAWAVGNQLLNLTSGLKDGNGTYSMRAAPESFAIWADMGYMVPPFLAHLGMATNSSDLLRSALEQYELESNYILDEEAHLHRHVSQDWGKGFWATGNGWMTYGLMRVLASVYAAGKQDELKDKVEKSLNGLGLIFTAMFEELNHESLLPNSMNESNATLARGESAGTALAIAAFYRYSVMAPDAVTQFQRDQAEKAFKGVVGKLGEDGWLTQVVDPSGKNGFDVDDEAKSPEGQSFLGMLWAAKTAADRFEAKTHNIASRISWVAPLITSA